jgi:AmmeMemoRadiSam system protein B
VAALADFPGAGDWEGTVALIGGHLPSGMGPLFAMEEAVETPLGNITIDGELRDLLRGETGGEPDRWQDNTVEVFLPMIKYFFPRAGLLWLRLPAEISSFEAGKILVRAARSLNRDLRVMGSTDLTHYGSNYGFYPQGFGPGALDWVRTVNDRRFIDAVESGDPVLVLKRAEGERSACSAGAVLGVMGYAGELRAAAAGPAAGVDNMGSLDGAGRAGGECIAYGTSADMGPENGEIPGSFVGYGAFVWR